MFYKFYILFKYLFVQIFFIHLLYFSYMRIIFSIFLYVPDTRVLSSRPSFLSNNIEPDVNATERKKMILKEYKII